MIRSSHIAAILTDPHLPDNPIIECNDAFLRLTGYDREEVIGRNCRFLAGEKTDPAASRLIGEAVDQQRPVITELLNYRKDGTSFRNAVMIAPLFDDEGNLQYFIGSQVDVTNENEGRAPERRQASRAKVDGLSPRQQQVLREMTAGRRNKQIAHALGVSERTVKMHKAALIAALGADTGAEAIRIAVEAGY